MSRRSLLMALHRHQSSLERVLDFSPPFSLNSQQRQRAATLLRSLVQLYGVEQTICHGFKPASLIQFTFEHVKAQDAFLSFYFSFLYENLCPGVTDSTEPEVTVALSFFDDFSTWDQNQKEDVNRASEKFAEYIVENFLLPLRASSVKTPQPTPSSLPSIQPSTPTGTKQRVSILRQNCLVRDHHRCVVSRKFDANEASRRWKQDGDDCKDDDGNLLKDQREEDFEYLEVAHILPHCLTAVASQNTELSDSKKNALRILDMFDPGIIHLIDGPKIDSPLNALTLTHGHHRAFGEFKLYFEPTSAQYQYRIDSMERTPFLRKSLFPVTRTLLLSPSRTIDPPSARLLGVHRAIAKIMNLSGAGEYIEKVLRDLEEINVRADGTTNLGRYQYPSNRQTRMPPRKYHFHCIAGISAETKYLAFVIFRGSPVNLVRRILTENVE
ncbi:hypothetical protein A7D00_1278 [Trichophyton violaceum]|uniref:HNH nuclease domain-containing protein n=1 Tax=Trichophyton violaceum TaxID=34388 RepID=A0A178FU95_TRIVO|nr:hypothetical protein A7D00_1278 [Trichophyton violaceum]